MEHFLRVRRIEFLMGADVTDLDLAQGRVRYRDHQGSRSQAFDLIIGADGKNSTVRGALQAGNRDLQVDIAPGNRYYTSFAGLPPEGDPPSTTPGAWSWAVSGSGKWRCTVMRPVASALPLSDRACRGVSSGAGRPEPMRLGVRTFCSQSLQ